MQSTHDTVHITPTEWRWVIFLGSALVILAFVPFLWVGFSGANNSQWQFMGVLNNYIDGATYLSKMTQGYEGAWLIHFRHTSEPHNAMFIQVIYPLLGQLARLVSIPSIALFHAARVVASLIMYMAIYHLAATIWPRRRSRRMFFIVAAIGSGLGWLLIIFTGDTGSVPDFVIPEMFPFYSSLVNVHFPLTIACLALISSVFIVVFRPGSTENPAVNNGGLLVGVVSFALSLLYPQSLVPFGLAAVGLVVLRTFHQHHINMRDVRWLFVIIVPALPLAAYYFALVNYNSAADEWNRQNVTLSPSPFILAIGLGVPLLMALPGIWRSIRRFEPDGDQFMLVWLVAMLIVMYLPTNTQRRFGVGIMIPIAYFATRALEGFWFNYANRRWRYRLLVAVVPTMTISYVLVLMGNLTVNSGPFLQRDYAAVFQWLKEQGQTDEVILAAPDVSAWIPGWTGDRVVYGHPFETLNASAKEQQVQHWYDGSDCGQVVEQYDVQYVLVGPQEQALGSTTCTDSLHPVFTYSSVTVYAP